MQNAELKMEVRVSAQTPIAILHSTFSIQHCYAIQHSALLRRLLDVTRLRRLGCRRRLPVLRPAQDLPSRLPLRHQLGIVPEAIAGDAVEQLDLQ